MKIISKILNTVRNKSEQTPEAKKAEASEQSPKDSFVETVGGTAGYLGMGTLIGATPVVGAFTNVANGAEPGTKQPAKAGFALGAALNVAGTVGLGVAALSGVGLAIPLLSLGAAGVVYGASCLHSELTN